MIPDTQTPHHESRTPIFNRKPKRRPLPNLRLHPYSPTMTLHDFLAHCQADAGTGIFSNAVQALKYYEDTFIKLRLHSDTVIPH
jgi:hypothetical protein